MCNCKDMARDLSETQDGRFKASVHSPMCEDFRLHDFACIAFDEVKFIVPADEAECVCENLEGEFSVEMIKLTQDQFDNIPEYEGCQ